MRPVIEGRDGERVWYIGSVGELVGTYHTAVQGGGWCVDRGGFGMIEGRYGGGDGYVISR